MTTKKTEIANPASAPAETASQIPDAPKLNFDDAKGGIFGGIHNRLAVQFLRKREAEFGQFAEREAAVTSCVSKLRDYETKIGAKRDQLAALEVKVASFLGFDPANTLFQALQNSSRPLELIIQDPLLVGAFMLKNCGADLLKIARRDLGDFEKQFTAWRAENSALLDEAQRRNLL